jgi:hypothetical protein
MVVSQKRRLALLLVSSLAVLGFLALTIATSRDAVPAIVTTLALVAITATAVMATWRRFLPWSSRLVLFVPAALLAVTSGLSWLNMPRNGWWPVGTILAMIAAVVIAYVRERKPKAVAA